MEDIIVTMTVDTVKLESSGGAPANSCVLSDNNGDTPGSETFEIDATSGQNVKFLIAAKNGSTPVSYKEFRYEGGVSTVFSPFPTSSDWTGTATGSSGQTESYYIDFYVNGTEYTLDPRIKIKGG